MTTTMPTPRRITTLQYLRAAVAERLGLEPDHEGADAIGWAEQLRQMRHADYQRTVSRAMDTATAVIPAVRAEVPAIAPVPYREVVDEHLGVLRIATQEPARFFDGRRYEALIGGAR